MAQVSLPYTLTAGQPENVNQLQADLDALVLGVNNVNASQIDSAAVGTSELADAGVTADKLGSTLAGQLGVSQTGTDRSVTVTQTAETTTTQLSTSNWAVIGTSSELATAANGVLQIGLWCEAKSSNAAGTTTVQLQVSNAGTWVGVTGFPLAYSSSYLFGTTSSTLVDGTTYRKIGYAARVPFVSGAVESSASKSQFRVVFGTNNASYTAYVKNLTATMTYYTA